MKLRIEKLLTPYNFSDRPAGARKIEYIVIHYFGSLGTAKTVANYFASAYRGASAHYALDEGNVVYQCVEDEDVAWHCGTSGTYYHPKCRNSNSIGIEVRPYIMDRTKCTDASYAGWFFTKPIVDNLVEFTKYLMKKYNIDADHVVRHYDVTHKLCPRPWVGSDTNLFYQTTGDYQWQQFKKRLVEEEDTDLPNIEDLTEQQCIALWAKITKQFRDNDANSYSAAAREWATSNGIVAGSGGAAPNYEWQAPMTREQFVTMLYRFAQFLGKA